MPDESFPKKSLSEISHLFLSSVRDNATGGARPKRLPPGAPREATAQPRQTPAVPRPDVSIDLTPEEFAQVFGGPSQTDRERPAVGPVSAVIGSHLNGTQLDRVRQYARHLAVDGKRVGLIEVDAEEFRVRCFDRGIADASDLADPLEFHDPRQMAEALDELAWDIDRWIVLPANPRLSESRALLRQVNHWVLLSTCDHDGVVSCYRVIKGLLDTHRPRLTLALLNPTDQVEAGKVHRKIAGVCQQFLNWPVEAEPAVGPADDVPEHLVMVCRSHPHPSAVWQVVEHFIARANGDSAVPSSSVDSQHHQPKASDMTADMEAGAGPRLVADVIVSPSLEAEMTAPLMTPPEPLVATPPDSPAPLANAQTGTDESEITDLPSGETTEAAVLSAVLKKSDLGLIECPVKAPMCPQAMLAVNRDRRLVLLAVARQGLAELRAIGQAYRWVIENRPLLSMALPQFSIDTHALPCLRLLVDRADLSADLLQPMLQAGNVAVQTYRKLRWGGKTGLLLEAA